MVEALVPVVDICEPAQGVDQLFTFDQASDSPGTPQRCMPFCGVGLDFTSLACQEALFEQPLVGSHLERRDQRVHAPVPLSDPTREA